MEDGIEGRESMMAPAALVVRLLFSGAGLAAVLVLSRLVG